MGFVNLTLESLKDLDAGRISVAFQQQLKRAVEDCMDRPGEKAARNVVMNVKIVPIIAADGSCEETAAEFQITSKVPARKSKTYHFGIKKGGILYFSENSPDAIDQTTLDDVDPKTGRVKREHKE